MGFSMLDGSVHRLDDLLDIACFRKIVDFSATSTFIPAEELIRALNNGSASTAANNILWQEFGVHRRFLSLSGFLDRPDRIAEKVVFSEVDRTAPISFVPQGCE
jgi:hypothetical protein